MSRLDLAAWTAREDGGTPPRAAIGDLDGYRYATNGVVLIRVPATGDPVPAAGAGIVRFFLGLCFDGCLSPLPATSGRQYAVKCAACKGTGKASGPCVKCDGSGECECPTCDDSHGCGTCRGVGRTYTAGGCETCAGKGKAAKPCPVRLSRDTYVDPAIVALLGTLTDVRIQAVPDGHRAPVAFVAAEGSGAFMPMAWDDEAAAAAEVPA